MRKKKIIIITEEQFNRLFTLKEAMNTFSLDKLKQLRTLKGIKEYCEKTLHRIGQGSSRAVYMLDDEKVLKVAKNKKGIAQNDVETDIGRYATVTPEIFDYDDINHFWIITERLVPLSIKQFKLITGVEWGEYQNFLLHLEKFKSPPPDFDPPTETDFFHGILDLVFSYNISIRDLLQPRQYGVNRENEIAVIDSGATDEVLRTYYS